MQKSELHRRFARSVPWLLPGLAAGLLLFLFNPVEYRFYPVCFFHQLTGLHCPGCGSLRALYQLSHGHLLTAAHFNPLLLALLPFLTWSLLRQFWQQLTGRTSRPVFTNRLCGWLILGLIVSFGILRNLPFAPFTWLAP
jgi:hypothetical protein